MRRGTLIDLRVDRALALADQGKVQEAAEAIAVLYARYPKIPIVQYGMGVVLALQERMDEALPCFDRAIELNPVFAAAWFNKGAAHQRKLEIADMVRAYRKAVELGRPDDWFVQDAKDILGEFGKQLKTETEVSEDEYLRRMDVFDTAFKAMERQEWEKALDGFKEILGAEPNHVQACSNMGICLMYLGRKKEALAAFDRALELDPHYKPARVNREAARRQPEGGIPQAQFMAVDYYRDKAAQKKSWLERIWERIWGGGKHHDLRD